jgi:plastocyanin
MRRGTSALAAAAAVAALGIAVLPATGGAKTARPAAKTLKLKANASGKLRFNKSTLHVRHGVVKIVMTNPSGSGKPHAVAVEGHGIDKDGNIASPGGKSRVTVKLKKGRYEFYCPVGNHKAAGMKGTLVVR